jgi:hypothetical protein
VAFCVVAGVLPSPKFHIYDALPVQFEGVAVPAKETGVPWTAVDGTVAVQASEHVVAAEIVIVPVCVQVTPFTEEVSVQLKVPVEV